MMIPDTLRIALTAELACIPQKSLTDATTRLSRRYRGDRSLHGGERMLQSTLDVSAYAAYRLPATYAAVYAALGEIRERRPEWYPQTLLDVGAGPGTGMWAVHEVWPELRRVTLLERERAMIDLGKRLTAEAKAPALRQAAWVECDIAGQWEQSPHDLLVMAYTLGELPSSRQSEIVTRLWSLAGDTLVLIEPGTPAGFSVIRAARQELIAAGARVIAPCPHQAACPMPQNDWCHFARRVSRTSLHRQVKQADLSYEDEKFSYVAVSREEGLPIAGRVIRHPQIRSGHIYLDLCTPDGLRRSVVTRKDREAFREARDLHWGDALS